MLLKNKYLLIISSLVIISTALLEYLELQGVILPKDTFRLGYINNGNKEDKVETENKN